WRVGAEIVCADAFQIYRGLAVLTAQPPERLRARAPHHLYGSVPPSEQMSAARFASLAWEAARGIIERGKVPVFVGGSGLYLQALEGALDPIPPPEPALRARISGMPAAEALAELRRLDPDAEGQVDVRNPRRVARALEIVLQTGRPLAASRTGRPAPCALRGIVLLRPREELRERIAANVAAMLRQGAIKEVRDMSGPAPSASRALGFKEISAFLAGGLAFDEMERRVFFATWQYARRQLTWFRHKSNFEALMVSGAETRQALAEAERRLREAV
ncbi:MAG: tRNA (adenosine(37)-N6)-dimethylallyltransferase MiaA, partial [Terrimicrobiaceae bacterium]|nr:tRNA (adenosine(37)-N6)-dimethylallyltransferase MiaA [Terrimicrobiaceae bacterium]